MSEPTFEQKQDHYHKIRRSNYLASLRLEGFVLAKYRDTPR